MAVKETRTHLKYIDKNKNQYQNQELWGEEFSERRSIILFIGATFAVAKRKLKNSGSSVQV